MKNIILIGMPACGKSTVGVVLAKTLGKAFLDTDLLIQEREKDLLQNIVDKHGYEAFVNIEENAIMSLDNKNTVIATGGSVVYSPKAMKYLKELGRIIYIKLPYEVIDERLHNISSRGIAMGDDETLKDIYDKRIPLYELYTDLTIEGAGLSVEGVVEEIIGMIEE